jgi:hypothetical protein
MPTAKKSLTLKVLNSDDMHMNISESTKLENDPTRTLARGVPAQLRVLGSAAGRLQRILNSGVILHNWTAQVPSIYIYDWMAQGATRHQVCKCRRHVMDGQHGGCEITRLPGSTRVPIANHRLRALRASQSERATRAPTESTPRVSLRALNARPTHRLLRSGRATCLLHRRSSSQMENRESGAEDRLREYNFSNVVVCVIM